MVLAAGDVFAGFIIEDVLGVGGMGVVYSARHPRMDRLVALKVLNDALATDRRACSAFDREAALAARLDHPNIVAVYDRSAPGDSVLWLAMRFIRGGDASSLLDHAPAGLAPELGVELIADAAAALDYAHAQGVLHRDVKPGNLLIEHDPRHGHRALLTDFGIARTLEDTVTLSTLAASFAYAAPERFTGALADHRADIYSLGCTLYHLLTGRPPFPRDDQAAVIGAHLSEPPPQPSHVRPILPAGLDTVVATALAKAPSERYPTCAALAEAARVAATSAHVRITTAPQPTRDSAPTARYDPAPHSGTGDRSPSPVSPSSRRFGRRGLLVGAAVAIPFIAATAAGITVRRSLTDSAPPADKAVAVLAGHPGAVYSVAFSPDRTLLASTGVSTSAGDSLRLWDLATHRPSGPPLTGLTQAVRSAAFSPDGALLATAGEYGTLRLWDLTSRQPSGSPLTGHLDGVLTVAFSADGTLLASAGADDTVRLWNVASRRPSGPPLTGHTAVVNSVAFSPDGTLLATASNDGTARLWDVANHQPSGRTLSDHTGIVNSVAFSPDGALLATASDDRTAILWDITSRRPSGQPLRAHGDRVWSVAFSPDDADGMLLASGSVDATVRLWDVRTHQQIGETIHRSQAASSQ
ncbi:serine/threonine-protein kinase [Nocardia sp. NPDC050710]|uniref:WD40 repeat domain-containing serine/threonine protein kinase n=1 Tax=Nocardia sp. NPDC050710 TaxID=3157220 RepID=UPI0033D6E278